VKYIASLKRARADTLVSCRLPDAHCRSLTTPGRNQPLAGHTTPRGGAEHLGPEGFQAHVRHALQDAPLQPYNFWSRTSCRADVRLHGVHGIVKGKSMATSVCMGLENSISWSWITAGSNRIHAGVGALW
jgi:hypothetical protein